MNTRNRILEAADELFYRDGIRSVSVDTIAEKADVTAATGKRGRRRGGAHGRRAAVR